MALRAQTVCGDNNLKSVCRPFPLVRHFVLNPLPDVSPSPPLQRRSYLVRPAPLKTWTLGWSLLRVCLSWERQAGSVSRAAVEHISSRPSVPLHGRLRLPREKKKCVSEAFSPGCRWCGWSGYLERLSTFAHGFGASLRSDKRSDYTLTSEPHWWLAWLFKSLSFCLLWFPTQMLEHDWDF